MTKESKVKQALRLVALDGKPLPKRVRQVAEQAQQDGVVVGDVNFAKANKHGLTLKQEAFAQAVAEGLTFSAAYRKAYDAERMSDAAVWQEGSRLAANPRVALRMKELREVTKPRASHDPGEVKAEIIRTLRTILSDSNAKQADRMKAAELLGRWGEVALFNDVSTVKVEQVEPEQAIDLLRDKLKKLAS